MTYSPLWSSRFRWVADRFAVLAALSLTAPGAIARADQWLPPGEAEYLTADKRFRFRVIPRGIASPLAYFEDKVAGRSAAGQEPSSSQQCNGVLEFRQSKWRAYHPVWRRALVNDVSPVSAVVSDDGTYVATFDNWHSTGYGPTTLTIYGANGSTVRSFGLYEFLLRNEIERLSRSVSSIHWFNEARFEPSGTGPVLVLGVRQNGARGSDDPPITIRIDPRNGHPLRSASDLETITEQTEQCRPDAWQMAPVDKGCEGKLVYSIWCNLCGNSRH